MTDKTPEEIGAMITKSIAEHPPLDSDEVELEFMSWGLMDNDTKAAWLMKHILGMAYTVQDGHFVFNGREPVLDHNLIAACEQRLDGERMAQYLRNCLSEASALAYKGMTPEQIQHPDTALVFYRTLMMLSLESHAVSMYWAYKGEDV